MTGSLYAKASAIISKRKQSRESEIVRRKNEVFSKIPRLFEIESQLDRYGIRMLNNIISGNADEMQAAAAIMAENKAFVKERAELLSANGYDENYLDVPPVCAKCGDTGFDGDKLCSCISREMTSIALSEANLSEALSHQTFENFDLNYYSNEFVEEYGCSPRENMEIIFKDCQNYVKSFSSGSENLLFCGGCGLGKTFLSSAIANELLKNYVDVLYVSSNAIFPILEDIHFGREVSDRSSYLVQKIIDCELLILDDLGSEFVTQFTCAELFRIINSRLLSNKKMIISTNLNQSMLSKTYTERISSRISGNFSIYEFLGTDIRKIKKLQQQIQEV